MKEDKYIVAKKQSWYHALIYITIVILAFGLGYSISLFPEPEEPVVNINKRFIRPNSNGLVGVWHFYDEDDYILVKKTIKIDCPDVKCVEPKDWERMNSNLLEFERDFKKKL